MRGIFTVLALFFCVSSSSRADIVWVGNFETGDRSQWSGTEMVDPDRLQVVQSPVREGVYALRASVQQGDIPIGSSGNRNELVYQSYEPRGSEYYYRWSTMFDKSFPTAQTWQVFTDWHHNGCCGSPPVEFDVVGEEIQFQAGYVHLWQMPLVRGVWLDFIFHARWSDDPSEGFVELYVDGEQVVPKTLVATQFPGMLNYLKQGLYRDASISPEGIVYHDAMIQATALDDVLAPNEPPPTPAPDEGVPPAPDAVRWPSTGASIPNIANTSSK